MGGDVTLDILKTSEQLEQLKEQWSELWLRDPLATPFQHPAWLIPWWHQFGDGELRIVTIRQNHSLIGLLPMYVRYDLSTREHQLLPLGISTSDYLGGIFAAECTTEHVKAVLQLLRAHSDWAMFFVSQLEPNSRLNEALRRKPNLFKECHSDPCCRMPATPLDQLPRKIRQNALYYRNCALRTGQLEFAVADANNCLQWFEEFRKMHTNRWKMAGEQGVLAEPAVLAWHREAIPQLQTHGLLRLCKLNCGGNAIAALYSLIDPPVRTNRKQYLYLTAYSPEHAEFRPGTLLLAFAIDHASREGVQVIDMLRGEEEYKRNWHLTSYATRSWVWRPAESSSGKELSEFG
jgi:CelD/BcsL family acetyltransferase involved in cellulose biosynthesis